MNLEAPLQYLHTAGPAADPATRLQWGLLAVCAVVFASVTVALVLGLARRRARPAGRELAVPADEGGMRWIYIGVALTVVALAACAAWTVLTIRATTLPAAAADLTVEVTAQHERLTVVDDVDHQSPVPRARDGLVLLLPL